SWLPREDVSKTPQRSRLNVRRQTRAAATLAEEMTQLQAIFEHCTARENAPFLGKRSGRGRQPGTPRRMEPPRNPARPMVAVGTAM
ncbi:MAG TPA: hypothetical protein VN541_19850, partial [Tepidisphaeraceae bacterium]|nr:hypothetical protein [Tepidisphaeraceae bacterium]